MRDLSTTGVRYLRVLDVSSHDLALLKSLLYILRGRLSDNWQLCEDLPADTIVYDSTRLGEDSPDARESQLVLQTSDRTRSGRKFFIQRPIHSRDLRKALNIISYYLSAPETPGLTASNLVGALNGAGHQAPDPDLSTRDSSTLGIISRIRARLHI